MVFVNCESAKNGTGTPDELLINERDNGLVCEYCDAAAFLTTTLSNLRDCG